MSSLFDEVVPLGAEHVALIEPTFEAWRLRARELLVQGVPPQQVVWRSNTAVQTQLEYNRVTSARARGEHRTDTAVLCLLPVRKHEIRGVPSSFVKLAESVACHADDARWGALYQVLWRITHGEASLLDVVTDADVHRLVMMDRAVRRAVHKMHAFVRFRAVEAPVLAGSTTLGASQTTYIAWFEPAHPVVQRASGLFVRRFASMRWSILTPIQCAHWDGTALQFSPGVSRAVAPSDDALEELWRTYYAHIFNPARVSIATMQAEMPKSYWRNLPEAALIDSLTRDAPARVRRMLSQVDEQPATLPLEMQSQVGEVSIPRRQPPVVAAQVTRDLDTPGAWDVVHDPGVTAARNRAHAAQVQDGSVEATTHDDVSTVVHLPQRAFATAGARGDVVRIGTASWTDPTILQRGVFYPDGVHTAEHRLRHYASLYSLVEVDSTYYVPPTRAIAAAWCQNSPDNFVFDIKAFALMTGHPAETKRFPDWLRRLIPQSVREKSRLYANDLSATVLDEVWARFQSALGPLRDAGKLGPILLQYPRWFTPSRTSADELRLARERLGDQAAAVEFRNPEWVTGRIAERTFALLEKLNLTYVIVDAPQGTASSMPPIVRTTTPHLAVVRLHGRRTDTWEAKHNVVSERYRYLYDHSELHDWASTIDLVKRQVRDSWVTAPSVNFPDMAKAKQGVHVVFNNCHANYGTTNADEITALLRKFDRYRLRS